MNFTVFSRKQKICTAFIYYILYKIYQQHKIKNFIGMLQL